MKYVKFCYFKFYYFDKVDGMIWNIRSLMDRLSQYYLSMNNSSSGVVVDTLKDVTDSNLGSSQPSTLVLDENKKRLEEVFTNEGDGGCEI